MATKTPRRKTNIVKPTPVANLTMVEGPYMTDQEIISESKASETPEQKIARLEATVAQQKEQLEKKGAMPGWLVITPNLFYNGKTAGIQFKNGRGFIAGNDEKAEKKAKLLCDDFGYERRFVEDFLNDADMAEEVGSNLVQVLLGSQVR